MGAKVVSGVRLEAVSLERVRTPVNHFYSIWTYKSINYY